MGKDNLLDPGKAAACAFFLNKDHAVVLVCGIIHGDDQIPPTGGYFRPDGSSFPVWVNAHVSCDGLLAFCRWGPSWRLGAGF